MKSGLPERSGVATVAVAVFLMVWGLTTHQKFSASGDEPHYLMTAESLVTDGDLDLANNYTHGNNRVFEGMRLEAGAHARSGKDGRLRPVHDIGLPLLFTPYYALAYRVTGQIVEHVSARWLQRARLNFTVVLRDLMSLAMIGLTAWIGIRLLEIFSVLSASSTRAFAWVLLMVLSPPVMSHSFLFFTEILSAFIALNVFLWLRGSPDSRFEALIAGAAVGYLFLVHARNVGLIAGLLLVAILRARRWPDGRRLLLAFIAGAAVLLGVRTAGTYHFWGTWLTTPHARFETVPGWQPFFTESLTRVMGWLFDQEHGLLPYAPIYLLAPAGWFSLWKRDRELCVDISLVITAYVGVMTVPMLNAHGWRGGWTPAARFLVPVAPMLAILAFSAVARVRRLSVVVIALVAVQVCLDAIVWQHPGLLWNDGSGTSALLKYLDGGTGRLSSFAPSFVEPVGGRTIAMVAAASIGCLLLTAWLTRRSDERLATNG